MDSASLAEIVGSHEAAVRLGTYVGVTAAVAAWEALMPRRARVLPRLQRWPSNFGIAALNTLIVRLAVPATAVGAASLAAERNWGLFHVAPLPFWLAVTLSVVLLDLAIYGQHALFHIVPPLWRLHRVHHTDVDVDVTTGARFHPIEILLSALLKIAAVIALGAPVLAVIAFEILLNAVTMFNHGNVRIPEPIDRVLRWVMVTPDMHRVHHSITPRETNSNYSFNLPWWDRLFGTYRAQPFAGHDSMSTGLTVFRDAKQQGLPRLLTQPFRQPDAQSE